MKNFHLSIDCPDWFKVGDWEKIESKLLKIGEFKDEPDACGQTIDDLVGGDVVDEMISECFGGNYHLRDDIKALYIRGNGECDSCGYPDYIEDMGYCVCPHCSFTWRLPEYIYDVD